MTVNEWDNLDHHYTIFLHDSEEAFDVQAIMHNMNVDFDLTSVYRLDDNPDLHSKIVITFDCNDRKRRSFFHTLKQYKDGEDVAAIYEDDFETA
jgi:hypothetical protein